MKEVRGSDATGYGDVQVPIRIVVTEFDFRMGESGQRRTENRKRTVPRICEDIRDERSVGSDTRDNQIGVAVIVNVACLDIAVRDARQSGVRG